MRLLQPLVPALLALAVAGGAPLAAQEEPLAAGSEGVPVPKKTRHVQPTYPHEALAQGVRGIVILDVVVDEQGKVESTSIVRSVPGLDEAAIAAARQWEYEPTRVDGKAVRVRITVPITFALALPRLVRQEGVPELRQGITPVWPTGTQGGGLATAEITLEPDGRVGGARILDGTPPWSEALLAALRTWRFAPPPGDEVLSFRVEAEFVSGRGSDDQRKVNLKATGVQRSGLLQEPAPPAATSPAATPPAAMPPAPTPEPAAAPPVPTPTATGPAETPAAAPPPASPASPAPGPASAPLPAAPEAPGAGPPAAPPVEVITAPPPQGPPENGVSAVRDVTLEAGVPDLARGRRPVAPPFARMSGTTGAVEVSFSVSAAGTTTIQGTTGPELLRPAAEQAVASWVFRRARADRAYLVAVFTYSGDKSSALVRPQTGPPPAPPAAPSPAAPSPAPPPSATPVP